MLHEYNTTAFLFSGQPLTFKNQRDIIILQISNPPQTNQIGKMKADYHDEYSSGMSFWNSDGNTVPEIISFTQLLQWNYSEDYAAFICYAHHNKALPIDYEGFDEQKIIPEITEVCIVEGYYERISLNPELLSHIITMRAARSRVQRLNSVLTSRLSKRCARLKPKTDTLLPKNRL